MCLRVNETDASADAPEDVSTEDARADATEEDAATCESAIFCGTPPVCCAEGTECERGACLPVCESGVRCGAEGDVCCGSGQVCISDVCEDPGAECTDSFECPENSFCEPTLGRCLPQFDPVTCETEPVFAPFASTVEREITTSENRPECFHAISAPIAIDLDGDGVPALLSNMACDDDWEHGVLRAVEGDTGDELWVAEVDTNGRAGIAAGDIRGDGTVLVIGVTANHAASTDRMRIIAFNASGNVVWRSVDGDGNPLRVTGTNGAPTLADLDGDGRSEVIFGSVVLDSNGVLIWQGTAGGSDGSPPGYAGGISAVADIDLDGFPDIVCGQRAYNRDGSLKWQASTTFDGYPAIGNFDADPQPEVALVANGSVYLLDGMDGSVQWGPVAIPGGGKGGPPTVSDFDGDGVVEIGVAGGASYVVFDPMGDSDILWSQPTIDRSSNATGSSVFDFEGDGRAEVVYQDECHVLVYSGADGEILLQVPSSSATIHEYPIVVDIDADGNSEIVIVANDRSAAIRTQCSDRYPGWSGARAGVFVYGDSSDQWVRTRRVWNQHAYHVTNVGADGSIPTDEDNNWEVEGLNNYRQNVQGAGVYNAPDLEIAGFDVSLEGCPESLRLRARIENVGSLGVPAGVPVAFYETLPGGPELIGVATTEDALLPGQTTTVELEVSIADLRGDTEFEFRVSADDDGEGGGVVVECNEGGNADALEGVACDLLI